MRQELGGIWVVCVGGVERVGPFVRVHRVSVSLGTTRRRMGHGQAQRINKKDRVACDCRVVLGFGNKEATWKQRSKKRWTQKLGMFQR